MLWYTVMSCSPSMLLFSQYLLSCVTVPHEALSYYAENVIVTDTICYLYHLIPPLLCVCTSAANRLIGEVVQSRRRPLLGPSPG